MLHRLSIYINNGLVYVNHVFKCCGLPQKRLLVLQRIEMVWAVWVSLPEATRAPVLA